MCFTFNSLLPVPTGQFLPNTCQQQGNPKQEEAAAKRSADYTRAHTHVKGGDTWQHKAVLKGLGAALQPSSHLLTGLPYPNAGDEQSVAEDFPSAAGRQGLQHHLSSEQISI